MIERIGFVEKARLSDARAIKGLIDPFAKRGMMLHRELDDIEENIGDYVVYREDGVVKGCGSLHVLEAGRLAEIRAVAVQKNIQNQGIGRRIIWVCLDKAVDMRVPEVFLLTYKPEIFGRFGFEQTVTVPPSKLLGECATCRKGPFPDCGEISMFVSNSQLRLPV